MEQKKDKLINYDNCEWGILKELDVVDDEHIQL